MKQTDRVVAYYLSSTPNDLANQTRITTRVHERDNNGTISFFEVVDRKVAFGHQGTMVVLKLYGKRRGVAPNSVGHRKVAVEESLAGATDSFLKVVIGQLHVIADDVQRYNWFRLHLRRRMDFRNCSIETVPISPRE